MRKDRRFMIEMVVVMMLTVLIYGCGDKDGSGSVKLPKGLVSTSDAFSQVTPRGARVESATGVTHEKLVAVDRGIELAIADGLASGYPAGGRGMVHSFYIAKIPVDPCVLSPFDRVPSFLVLGNNYDGSKFDQYNTKGELPASEQTDWARYVPDGRGVIYAAELTLQLGNPGSTHNGQPANNTIGVLCLDDAVLENGARYMAEHGIISNHDPEYHGQTWTHWTIGHPLLPKAGSRQVDNPLEGE